MKIAIAGYYGFNNLGDELILSTLIDQLRKKYQNCEMCVFSASVEKTQKQHSVQAVDRWSPWALVRTMWSADIFVLGGGGLIQNKTSTRSLLYFLSLIFLARLFHNHIVLYSLGVETVRGTIFKKIIRYLFTGPKTKISVRDNESKNILISYGISPQSIQLTVDPVFMLNFEPASRERYHGGPSTILLIPRLPVPEPGQNLFDQLLRIIIEDRGIGVKATLFEPESEADLARTSYLRQIPFISNDNLSTHGSQLGFFDYVISARFHGLVLASLVGLPFMGIGDEDKIRRFCFKMGMPFVPWSAEREALNNAIDLLISKQPGEKGQLLKEMTMLAKDTLPHVFP